MIHYLLTALLAFSPLASAQSFWVAQPPRVDGKKPPKPPPPACSSFGWCDQGNTAGVSGSYTPVVPMGGDQVRIFGNTNGSVDGNLYLRVGSWSSVGSASLVLNTTGQDDFIRTSGIARGASGMYYGVIYVGLCYGCTGGFSPAFVTSPDGMQWTYHGRISPFGVNQSSAMNLIVDESRTDAYRFMFWMDIPSGLMLVHSGDGVSWSSDGVGVWPIAGDGPQFCGATKTPHGYHMLCSNGWPATAMRHVFSCTGFPPWRVLEMASVTFNASVGKGANLSYDPATDSINALVSGRRWTLPASPAVPYPC